MTTMAVLACAAAVLGLRGHLAGAGRRPLPVHAGLGAVLADADVLRPHRAVVAGARLAAGAARLAGGVARTGRVGAADLPVAVRVHHAGAALRAGCHRASAWTPGRELTRTGAGLCPVLARADAARRRGARVAGSRGPCRGAGARVKIVARRVAGGRGAAPVGTELRVPRGPTVSGAGKMRRMCRPGRQLRRKRAAASGWGRGRLAFTREPRARSRGAGDLRRVAVAPEPCPDAPPTPRLDRGGEEPGGRHEA
jgi:hypothetical protein